MTESFLDRLAANPAPATTTVTVSSAAGTGTGTPYALAALAGEVENLRAVPIGQGRNHQLNKSAVKMYGLAAGGHIDEHLVTETLGAADGGLDYPATRRSLASAREAVFGRLGARVVPESTTNREEVLPPWERESEDPPADAGDPTASTGEPPTRQSATSSEHPASADSAPGLSTGTAEQSEAPAPDPYAALVQAEAKNVRLRRDAVRLVDAEDADRTFVAPLYVATLADELALPDEPITYRVRDLLPAGGNVVLGAQFKAGKTTTVSNLIRSLADGVPFLDRFEVDEVTDGRVVMWNYEVGRDQYRRWLRDIDVENADRVSVLTLRGLRMPLHTPKGEQWAVDYLRSVDARVWILDPLARAASGLDENSNVDMGVFFETLDVIKERAGVRELIVPAHTGRGEFEQGAERVRGATRIDDWPDVRWLLVRDPSGERFFHASGRDVEVDEGRLDFEPATRRLTYTALDRRAAKRDRLQDVVTTVVEARPGIGAAELRDAVKASGGVGQTAAQNAITAALGAKVIHKRRSGHTQGHYLGGLAPWQSEDDPA